MSPAVSRNIANIIRFPRVSGDEPGWCDPDPETPEFSPRERG